MGKLFNEEKVLYFANQKNALHVSCYELPTTDLYQIVSDLLRRRLIERIADDDSGDYYRTTPAGEKRLLHLQIQWRKQHGKDVSEHASKLADLGGV